MTFESFTFLNIMFAVGYAVVCAGLCANVAVAKNHNEGSWLFAGLLFGVLALIAIAGHPVKAVQPKPDTKDKEWQ